MHLGFELDHQNIIFRPTLQTALLTLQLIQLLLKRLIQKKLLRLTIHKILINILRRYFRMHNSLHHRSRRLDSRILQVRELLLHLKLRHRAVQPHHILQPSRISNQLILARHRLRNLRHCHLLTPTLLYSTTRRAQIRNILRRLLLDLLGRAPHML